MEEGNSFDAEKAIEDVVYLPNKSKFLFLNIL
jgi:hypothetical protein